MDVVTLLRNARMQGVRVSTVHGELRIEAAKAQQEWVDKLAPHKHELVSILRTNGNGNGKPTPPPRVRPATDLANGERFAEQHGADVRFCHDWAQWFVWNGRRWQRDATDEVVRLAKTTAKRILIEAANAPDDDCKALTAHAHASQSRARLDAMIELGKSEQPIPAPPDAFDCDRWLLNFENGTIDLHTGQLRPHDRGDLLTKSTGVEFPDEPGVDAILWREFLDVIFDGDADLISYLQRLMGSALPGVIRENILPIFHGNGSNGKTVFVETIQAALGDYSLTAPPGLLMAKRGDQHPCEIADLHGKRLVMISETRDGARLDEGLVKQLTGGDRIRARRMRENFWSFDPSHTPFLITNHLPVVRGTDLGIWRRLRRIPFMVTIPPERQDKQLAEKLRAELPAIAAWLVQGCLNWQRDGLAEPASVSLATEGYRVDSDAFRQWFEERCLCDKIAVCRASDAYRDYCQWCERSGERATAQKAFSHRLTEQRFTRERARDGYRYVGFGLITESVNQ